MIKSNSLKSTPVFLAFLLMGYGDDESLILNNTSRI